MITTSLKGLALAFAAVLLGAFALNSPSTASPLPSAGVATADAAANSDGSVQKVYRRWGYWGWGGPRVYLGPRVYGYSSGYYPRYRYYPRYGYGPRYGAWRGGYYRPYRRWRRW